MPAPRQQRNEGGLIGHLAAQAAAKPVNSGVSITKYYACAQLLLRQAESYRKAGVEEQEYVMIMRFASLIVETIPKHKDFNPKDPQHKQMKQLLLTKYMPIAEQLKYNLKQRDIIEPMARSRNRPADAVRIETSALNEVNWGTANPVPAAPQPNYNLDDLLDVVQNGPGSAKPLQPSQPPPPPPSQSQPRPELPSPPAYQPKYSAANERHDLFLSSLPSSQAITRSASSTSLPPDQNQAPQLPPQYAQQIQPSAPPPPPTLQRYPSLHTLQQQSQQSSPPPLHLLSLADGSKTRQQQQQQMALQLSTQQQQGYQQARSLLQAAPPPSAGPTPPPQPIPVVMQDPNLQGLPRTCCTPPPPPQQPGLQTMTTYSLTAQQPLHHSQSAYPPLPPPPPPPPQAAQQGQPQQSAPAPKEGGGGMREVVKRAQLRDVHVSIALMEEFLAYARSNTAKGIESCGILAGQLSANDSLFTITTLIIPKQQGTSDTVQALNEEEVFDVQFSRELYPLGWIHTHPTQTCFLSSVDVHTHCGYQTMLEEAIAIVMAPNDRSKRCGLFRLSTPGGLQLVQRCNKRGFHPHPPTETGQELYELCGHVYLNPRTKHEVIDLR